MFSISPVFSFTVSILYPPKKSVKSLTITSPALLIYPLTFPTVWYKLSPAYVSKVTGEFNFKNPCLLTTADSNEFLRLIFCHLFLEF